MRDLETNRRGSLFATARRPKLLSQAQKRTETPLDPPPMTVEIAWSCRERQVREKECPNVGVRTYALCGRLSTHGGRDKDSREATMEIVQQEYPNSPVDGPSCVLHMQSPGTVFDEVPRREESVVFPTGRHTSESSQRGFVNRPDFSTG